jgi:Ca-activated chloride channel family protein
MRKPTRRHLFLGTTGALASVLAFTPVAAPLSAQDQADEDEYDAASTVIVTGARIRQGGAQDIKHFRSVSLNGEAADLPYASSFTLEGLLGEHDLTLPALAACEKLFCVNAQSMAANLPSEPASSVFVGLGFESGVDAEAYKQTPISLIAVVDRSGSMSGKPLQRVKEGLHAALGQMRDNDRIGIVIYGSDTRVHMPVMDVAGNREQILAAIDGITINGATYMEAGLKLGYQTAFEELERSNGKTRLMLFSDENANVGNTSPEGFMGQASRGAEAGIGLTSIGVGRIFDGRLAKKISSVKGGNLFFVDREGDAGKLFEREFFNMISEVARDIEISIDPAPGYSVASVYGVPDDILTRREDGTVTASIGSAFLSSNGGGIFASLTGAGRAISPASISISYTDALNGERGSDNVQLGSIDASPPANLRRAQLLVDQYSSVRSALAAYHADKDPWAAQAQLTELETRIASSGLDGMDDELKLVSGLRETATRQVAIFNDPAQRKMREIIGAWKVLAHRGVDDISRGDLVEITDDGSFITEDKRTGDEIYQDYEINERQIHIKDGNKLVMYYRVNGNRLRMRNSVDGTMILLERDES